VVAGWWLVVDKRLTKEKREKRKELVGYEMEKIFRMDRNWDWD
jgi:hypothetical protein